MLLFSYHCAIFASMAAFAERRRTSTSRVPPAKREAVDEMLEGAVDALSSSAFASAMASGIMRSAVDENCANSER